MRIISPSILAADFGNLGRDVAMLNESRAEWIHFDVMDGVFVPNISFGFPVLQAVRRATDKVLDVHLMITDPIRYVRRFAEAGADIITFHFEAAGNPRECISAIREAGARVGISIKPATDVSVLGDVLEDIDMVLVMSVEPGFGGQSFIESSLGKISGLKSMIRESGADCLIEVDGGISDRNAAAIFGAGADVLVAGSSVFKAEDPESEILKMLEAK